MDLFLLVNRTKLFFLFVCSNGCLQVHLPAGRLSTTPQEGCGDYLKVVQAEIQTHCVLNKVKWAYFDKLLRPQHLSEAPDVASCVFHSNNESN